MRIRFSGAHIFLSTDVCCSGVCSTLLFFLFLYYSSGEQNVLLLGLYYKAENNIIIRITFS